MADYNDQGQVLFRYINGAGVDERVAWLTYRSIDSNPDSYQRFWYQQDHQNNVFAPNAGGTTHRYAYDSFGGSQGAQTVGQPFRFTGEPTR